METWLISFPIVFGTVFAITRNLLAAVQPANICGQRKFKNMNIKKFFGGLILISALVFFSTFVFGIAASGNFFIGFIITVCVGILIGLIVFGISLLED